MASEGTQHSPPPPPTICRVPPTISPRAAGESGESKEPLRLQSGRSQPGQAGDFPTPEIVALAFVSPGGFVNLPTTAVCENGAQLSDLVLQACYLIRGQGLDTFFYPVQLLGDMGVF